MSRAARSRVELVVARALWVAALSPLAATPAAAQTSAPPVAPASNPGPASAPARCGPDELCDVLPLVAPTPSPPASTTEAPGRTASDPARSERVASQPSLRLPAELCLRQPRRNAERCLDEVFRGIPEYQGAIRRRRAGALVAALGAGIGGGLITLAAMGAAFEAGCLMGACRHPDYATEKIMAGVGGALVAVGLAVGLPLYVSGTSRRDAIRARYLGGPVFGVGAGPGQGLVTARWWF